MTKALVCCIKSNVSQRSSLQKLFGDPDDYAYKFGNDTFADKLPIHQTTFSFPHYDFFHSISIDYEEHRVYYSNHEHERLEYGMFVHHNDTHSYYLDHVPNSNQVTTNYTLQYYAIRIVCQLAGMYTKPFRPRLRRDLRRINPRPTRDQDQDVAAFETLPRLRHMDP